MATDECHRAWPDPVIRMTNGDPIYDERLSAMCDGEEPLDSERLASDPASADVLRQWQGLGEALRGLPRYQLPEDFAERVWAAANSDALPVAGSVRRRRFWRAALAVATCAAVLLLVVFLGPWKVPQHVADKTQSPAAGAPKSSGSEMVSTDSVQTPQTAPAAIQYLLVVDATLTEKGLHQHAFDQILGQAGIPVDASIGLDRQLENVLMKSRFLVRPTSPSPTEGTGKNVKGTAQAKTPEASVGRTSPKAVRPASAAGGKITDLVYVIAPATQIDTMVVSMKQQREWFSRVHLDLATKPDQLKVFQQLRRASRAVLAGDRSSDRVRAHHVAVPSSWLESRRTRTSLPLGLIGLPQSSLVAWVSRETDGGPPLRKQPSRSATSPPQRPTRATDAERMAELAQRPAEALFVLRVEASSK